MVQVGRDREIPEGDLSYALSRSSGPGGQNVNKVESKVTLLFDLEGTVSLSLEEKEIIHAKLPGRINKEGVLRVTSQRHRTQAANRNAARQRFAELIERALAPRVPRKKTPGSLRRSAPAARFEAPAESAQAAAVEADRPGLTQRLW